MIPQSVKRSELCMILFQILLSRNLSLLFLSVSVLRVSSSFGWPQASRQPPLRIARPTSSLPCCIIAFDLPALTGSISDPACDSLCTACAPWRWTDPAVILLPTTSRSPRTPCPCSMSSGCSSSSRSRPTSSRPKSPIMSWCWPCQRAGFFASISIAQKTLMVSCSATLLPRRRD